MSFVHRSQVELNADLEIRTVELGPQFPDSVIIDYTASAPDPESRWMARTVGSIECTIGFGYALTSEAVEQMDRLIAVLQEVRASTVRKLAAAAAPEPEGVPFRILRPADARVEQQTEPDPGQLQTLAIGGHSDIPTGDVRDELPWSPGGNRPTPAEQSPGYRSDMRDAGRGDQLP